MILESNCVTEDLVDNEGYTIRRVTINIKYVKGYPIDRILETLNVVAPQGFRIIRRSLSNYGRESYNVINEIRVYTEAP